MTRAMDEHGWRDAGVGSGGLHVQELSPGERKAALEAQERRDAGNAEALRESLTAPVVAEEVMGEHIDVAVARASVIETPAEKRARQLGFVEHEGQLVHRSELQRREAQREREDDYEQGGVSQEEYQRFLASEGLADEEEEDDGGVY
jgi:hypothetical protein